MSIVRGRSRPGPARRIALLIAILLLTALPPSLARAATIGYRDFSYGAAGVSAPTGEKPQSKLWFADGSWWGALFSRAADAFTVHELSWATQTWRDTGVVLEPRNNTYLDVLWDGSRLYVSSAGIGATSADSLQVRRLSYSVATRTYSLDAGFPVIVETGGMEAAVMDKDSAGVVWVTWTRADSVYLAHTTTSDTAWTAPFVIPVAGSTTLTPDDISSVVAYDGKIGVMWSNQTDWTMYFAYHVDGAPDGSWTVDNAIQQPEYADDHMNLKSLQADPSGRLFAVTKTSLNAASAPLILVLVHDRSGGWQRRTFGTVADNHTRAMLLIDSEHGQLYVLAASPCCSGGTIYYKTAPLANNINFPTGLGTPFIQSDLDPKINNISSTKQTLTSQTGLVAIAGDDSTKMYLHNAFTLQGATDTTPPDTSITAAPADGSPAGAASFSFTSTEPGSTFQCKLDAAAYAGCASPTTYPAVSAGSHTFNVRATDPAGNVDQSPASHTWTVAPAGTSGTTTLGAVADTWIDEASPNATHGTDISLNADGGTGIQRQALLRFDASAIAGTVTSAHLRLYVTNGTGNGPAVVPTATTWSESAVSWATKPAATGGAVADATTMALGAYFDYDVTAAVVAGQPVSLSLVPQSTDGLVVDSREGAHPPELIVDWSGGGGGDLTPPQTTIDSGPSGTTTATTASFTFSANEPSTFACSLDGAAFGACTSPKSYTGLAGGSHTFAVRATDTAGNVDSTPASQSWTIDTAVPDTTITAGPSGLTNQTTASFSFSATEPATFECQVDAGSWTECTSPRSLTALSDGSHTFAVRATDVDLNTDPSPASRTWTVDATAPTITGRSPADGATGVATTSRLTATFSEAVDAASVTSATFTLTPAGGSAVAATVTRPTTTTAQLAPSAALAYATTYTAAVSGIRDLAGNPVSGSWSFTTAGPPTSATFTPTADTYVDEKHPTQNKGTATSLYTLGTVGSRQQGLLRFSVSGLPAPVTQATLRLWVTNGSADGPDVYGLTGSWTETGVKWPTRPTFGSTAVATTGSMPLGRWVEYDVTSQVNGNGTVEFGLSQTSGDASRFDSREGVNKPQLVVDWS